MELVGGVGALYKLDEAKKIVVPVGTFLEWECNDETGQIIVEANELYIENWPVKAPLHIALFSGASLFLGDNVGVPYAKENEEIVPTGDFMKGPFYITIGFLWQRVPAFTVNQWKKTVLEDGQLYEALERVTEVRKKSGAGTLNPMEFSFQPSKEPIGKGKGA